MNILLHWLTVKKYKKYNALEWFVFTVAAIQILLGIAFLISAGHLSYRLAIGETIEMPVTERITIRNMNTDELVWSNIVTFIVSIGLIFFGYIITVAVKYECRDPSFILNYKDASVLLFPFIDNITEDKLDDEIRETIENLVEKAGEFERDFPEIAEKMLIK